jgi:hypothetical protein
LPYPALLTLCSLGHCHDGDRREFGAAWTFSCLRKIGSKALGDTQLAAELKCKTSRLSNSGQDSSAAVVLFTAGLSRELVSGTTIVAKASTEKVISCVLKTSLATGMSLATSLQWCPTNGKKGGLQQAMLPKAGVHLELW